MEAAPLYDLLLALFDDGTELRRFLAVVGLAEVEHRLPARKGEALRSLALDVARALDELGLVNESLFSALAQRAGSRSGDVWAVAELYGVRPPGDSKNILVSGQALPRALPPRDVPDRDLAGRTAGPPPVPPPGPPPTPPPGPPPAPPPVRPRRRWRVWRAGRVSKGAADTAGSASGPPPDKYADFARELEEELAAVAPVDTAGAALEPSRWPWTAAAAVLGSFRPTSLRPLSTEAEPSEPAVTALSAVVYTTFDGRWALSDAVRTGALARLHQEGSLEAAVEANAGEADPARDWLRRLLAGEQPGLARLESAELEALDVAARWLEPLGLGSQLARAALYAVIERRRLIDPLRALVGQHFRGRVAELAQVEHHIGGQGPAAVMVLRGPGGVGKSTLVGKVLLDLEDRVSTRPLPFAYVDFDKRHNDPNNPVALLEQIARQLRLLFAASAEGGRQLANVEAVISGTDVAYAAEFLNLEAEFDRLDLDRLVLVLSDRLRALTSAGDDAPATPLLLVLDTFEEVQMQGPGPVDAVLGLVRRFLSALPDARVIVSGRSEVPNLGAVLAAPGPVAEVTLGDLDPEAATALLERLGVDDAAIRSLVVERFGGNPLTLRLGAEALRRVGSAEKAFGDVVSRTDVVAEVALEQVQGVLYSRILGHIGDPEIVRVAHPGLAVRRVDVDVIRKVLSGPCEIDPAEAERVFDRLRREVSLFELEDDGSLRHRQDVRRLMLRAMVDEPRLRPQVQTIHRLAAEYYAGREGPMARGEELYHRLMCDEDPRTLASLWTPELRGSLASALEEPLRPRARQWLQRRLGRDDGEDRDLWDHEEWEMSAAERARSWLGSGQPDRALDVLRERRERAPGSALHALEATALLDLERLDEAQAALDHGMSDALDAGDRELQATLAELAVRLASQRQDPAGIVAATRTVVRLADLTGEKQRALDVLCRSTEALRQVGAAGDADALAAEVGRRFSELPALVLRDHPELVREVLLAAGPTESNVVVRAAVELGDALRDRVFRDDAFALTRLLEQTSAEGRPQLNRLAAEVGLTGPSWSTTDLARSLSRSGRVGQAVLVGLDFATDVPAARQLVVSELVHPTSGPTES